MSGGGLDGHSQDAYCNSAGVARLQGQVTPRRLEHWQCPTLKGGFDTLASLVAHPTPAGA
jgi:hypothetical protein